VKQPARTFNVATVGASAAFVAVALDGGRFAVMCRSCGASLRLARGFNDARGMTHAANCTIGDAIAGTTKPILLSNAVIKEGEKCH